MAADSTDGVLAQPRSNQVDGRSRQTRLGAVAAPVRNVRFLAKIFIERVGQGRAPCVIARLPDSVHGWHNVGKLDLARAGEQILG
jgi:hypothetical protein